MLQWLEGMSLLYFKDMSISRQISQSKFILSHGCWYVVPKMQKMQWKKLQNPHKNFTSKLPKPRNILLDI